MQYILTEAEFSELRDGHQTRARSSHKDWQDFCTLAALHIPVKREWAPDAAPKPWGCILVEENNPRYCDRCPAREVCPNKNKEFSK